MTIKQSSVLVLIAALSRPHPTGNLILGQQKWKAGCSIFHEISYPSLASMLWLEVGFLAIDAGFDQILVLSSSALISIRTLTLSHFSHMAVNQVCPKWSTNVIVCSTTFSHFLTILRAETGTTGSRKNQVTHSFIETPVPFLVESPVTGSRFAANVFRYYSIAHIKHEAQNFTLVELITFAKCLAITAMLGFCASLCCYRTCSFTICRHIFVSHQADDLFLCRHQLGPPKMCDRRNLTQSSRHKHRIQKAYRVPYCSAICTSIIPSSFKSSDACALIHLIERITACLRIKCCAFLRCPVLFNAAIMTLIFHLLLHNITHAQQCEQMMLGFNRSNLATTTLLAGLMFFAGGESTGASSWHELACCL
jgi:hypothetical protein